MAQEDKAASPPNDDGNVGGGTPSPPPSPRTPVSVRDRLTKGTRILGGVALIALAAWAIVFVSHRYRQQDLAVGDMEKQYHDMIRKFGMSPVYPPREDFRVGDLFFTAFNEKHEAISRIWIGNMKGFVEQADTYAASFRARSNNVSLPREKEPGREVAQDPGKEVVKEKSPEPHVNQWLENLPIVSFPTIRGSSAGRGRLRRQRPRRLGLFVGQPGQRGQHRIPECPCPRLSAGRRNRRYIVQKPVSE